jgi:elongation factor P hydroxylase
MTRPNLPPDDWRRQLGPGDEVAWHDPDDRKCSYQGKIAEISIRPDDSAWILFADGHELEVMLHELS